MHSFEKHEDKGKLILRLMVGVLLLLHGISKVKNGVDWLTPMLAAHHLPGFVRFGVYVGEIVAPIFLIVGIFSRLAGMAVFINMVFAVFLARTDALGLDPRGGNWGIELEALYAFGGAAIYCLGSGKYALSRGKGKWD
jgi:putative oxidoreductase